MKPWLTKVAGFGLASFFGDVSHEMTIALIPLLAATFLDQAQLPLYLGIMASFSDACASMLRIFSGYLSDQLPRKKPLIIIGYTISTLFSALTGYAKNFWQLLMYRLLAFTGSGFREPPRDALIAAIISPQDYGKAIGLRNAMDTVGALIGPLITVYLISSFTLQNIFALSLIPGIAAAGAILFFTEDLLITQPKNRPPQHSLWQSVKELPRPFFIFIALIFVFDVGVFNKLLLLARAQELLVQPSATALVLLYALFNAARACSEFLIGFISDFVNRIMLLSGTGCLLFAGSSYLLTFSQGSFGLCALIFCLIGTSTAATYTLKKACAADMLPPEHRGLGYGLMQASQGSAGLISSALIGYLWSRHSAYVGFSYSMTLSLSAAVLLALFAWFKKRRN